MLDSKNPSVPVTRKAFIGGLSSFAAAAAGGAVAPAAGGDVLDVWQKETDSVKPADYQRYLKTGDTQSLASLEKLEAAFEKAMTEIKTCKVGAVPAVWHVYNMGYVVKTREALFSIDLNHRRDLELVPDLDFALITHNHGDHYRVPFYKAMDKAGKTVVNNFAGNYGAADWRKGGPDWWARGGYTRGERTFAIKDVEIRTALTDHNPYLIDFTTTFEIRVGKWRLFHTGDCGNAAKLKTVWGKPDLWLVFPGCGIDIAAAYNRIKPKKMAFGHLWELAHDKGRLTTPMVKSARAKVEALGGEVGVPLWGERVV